MTTSHGKRFIVVRNDEVARYSREFTLLCDRLDVCEEIREGYYSDEAHVSDLFSFLEPRDNVQAQIAALELPGITRSSYLIDALRAIRQLWVVQH